MGQLMSKDKYVVLISDIHLISTSINNHFRYSSMGISRFYPEKTLTLVRCSKRSLFESHAYMCSIHTKSVTSCFPYKPSFVNCSTLRICYPINSFNSGFVWHWCNALQKLENVVGLFPHSGKLHEVRESSFIPRSIATLQCIHLT